MTTQPNTSTPDTVDPGLPDGAPDVPPQLILQYVARIDADAGTRHLNEAIAMASQHVLIEALDNAKKGL